MTQLLVGSGLGEQGGVQKRPHPVSTPLIGYFVIASMWEGLRRETRFIVTRKLPRAIDNRRRENK